jgi:hypothetical protein
MVAVAWATAVNGRDCWGEATSAARAIRTICDTRNALGCGW